MNPVTIEELRNNPELLAALRRRAHRARSEAAYDLVVAIAARLKWTLREIGSIHVSGRTVQG